jgi:hypothetical protein
VRKIPAVVTLSQPVVNGQHVIASLHGKSRALGDYTGQFESFFGLGTGLGTGEGTLTAADGDQINVAFREDFQPPAGGQSHGPGRVTMVVTGGTGAFANATGHGTATGLANPTTSIFRYALNLRVRT